MYYEIHYSCMSHVGHVRRMNQDNFICNRLYMKQNDAPMQCPICGVNVSKETSLFGVFDGMGGEACGEVAALIASKVASEMTMGKNAVNDLARFCEKANSDICNYASTHSITSMGTTAAVLAFTKKEVVLCNIGDSKIFRFRNGVLEQLSKDHVSVSPFGVKPPLYQSLGIPPDELIIEPYLTQTAYKDGDLYLICSDGLTDMLPVSEIRDTLASCSIHEAVPQLLDRALANGGKDNITIILCKLQRQSTWHSLWKHFKKSKEVSPCRSKF